MDHSQDSHKKHNKNHFTLKKFLPLKTIPFNESHIQNQTLHTQENLFKYTSADLSNFTIGGYFERETFGIISYHIKMCDHETEKMRNIMCTTENGRIEKYHNQFFVAVKSHTYSINPSSYSRPNPINFKYSFQSLHSEYLKEKYLFYSKSSIVTDTGLFSSSYEFISFLLQDYSTSDFSPISLNDSVVFKTTIHLTNMHNIYARSYITMTGIAASVGAYMSVVTLV